MYNVTNVSFGNSNKISEGVISNLEVYCVQKDGYPCAVIANGDDKFSTNHSYAWSTDNYKEDQYPITLEAIRNGLQEVYNTVCRGGCKHLTLIVKNKIVAGWFIKNQCQKHEGLFLECTTVIGMLIELGIDVDIVAVGKNVKLPRNNLAKFIQKLGSSSGGNSMKAFRLSFESTERDSQYSSNNKIAVNDMDSVF